MLCVPPLDVQANDREAPPRRGRRRRGRAGSAGAGPGPGPGRMRFTVRGLGRCPKRAQQMVVISWVLSGAYSRLSAIIAWRMGAECRWRRRRGEAGHAGWFEGVGLPVEGALGDPGLAGADAGRQSREDDGTEHLVAALRGKPTQQLQLLPVIGRLDPLVV